MKVNLLFPIPIHLAASNYCVPLSHWTDGWMFLLVSSIIANVHNEEICPVGFMIHFIIKLDYYNTGKVKAFLTMNMAFKFFLSKMLLHVYIGMYKHGSRRENISI